VCSGRTVGEKRKSMSLKENKAIFGWSMYDWANSAFATTVIAGFFPVFFKQFWCMGTDVTTSTARLGLANSIAGVMVAVAAPVLGAIADRGGKKKAFLMSFAFMGVVMTSALYMVSEGNWPLAIFLFVGANIGFSGGNIFYDSLLPYIASKKKMDSVSSLGFSMGYLGGGMLFALNVWMSLRPEIFGFADTEEALRFSFLSVGIWWALFSVPIFLFVKEPKGAHIASGARMIKAGIFQLKETFQEIKSLKNISLFLLAYWIYIDGVDTIIRMALAYGMSIGFDSKDLILALLITQFVGFPSALAFGYLGGKIGTKTSIFIAIAVYLFVSIWGAFIVSKQEFYMLAVIIGLVQGGIQALSRSYFAKIIPVEKSAEYFGFYNMVGRFAVVIGPVFMGGWGILLRSVGYSPEISSRLSISSISLLFLTGGVLLYFVKEERTEDTH
jgi:UMF1 family MFS transporter